MPRRRAAGQNSNGAAGAGMKLSRKKFLELAASSTVGSLVVSSTSAAAATEPSSKKLEKSAIKGATAATARFIRSAALSHMPPAVVAQATRCLVDGFGVILAGATVRGSEIVREYVKS